MYKAFGVKHWETNRFDKGVNQKFGFGADVIAPTKRHTKKHTTEIKKSTYQTQKQITGAIKRNERAAKYEAKRQRSKQSFITKMINMFR